MKSNNTNLTLFIMAISCLVICSSFYIKHFKTIEKPSIEFIEQDWNKTLKVANEKDKWVFVDLYATWCGPCKLLKKNTFSDKEVADFFNTNFVNASIDVDKGIGVQLAEKYSVSLLPTLLVTDKNGNLILRTTGYMKAGELLDFAKAALKRKK